MIVVMGSGAETVARDRRVAERARRAGRRAAGAAVPAVPGARRCSRRCPRPCARDRRARPHQGARLDRRAALPRRGRGAGRGARRRRARGDAAGHRRPLRPVVEGVHARHGRRRVRRAGARAAAAPLHRRHQRRRLRHEPRRTTRRSTSSRPRRCARSSSASARTARSAPTRTRSRSSGRGPGRARPGLLRLRLEEVRLADGLAPALRPQPIRAPYLVQQAGFVGCHQFGLLDRVDVLGRGGARRDAAAQLPAPAGRGLGRAAAPGAGADPRQAHRRSTRSTPTGSPARPASAGRINIVLQTCFFAISGVLPRERGDRADQGGDRARPTADAAPRWCERNQAAVDRTLDGAAPRSRCPTGVTGDAASCRRSCPRTRPSSSAP